MTQRPPVTLGRVIVLTWPMVLSNIATPLLGLVDTAVIGNVGDAAALGGLALGAIIFNALYWTFGFLRMGTTGLTAQAEGARDGEEIRATLLRALGIAWFFGLAFVALQVPLATLALRFLSGSADVETAALAYFQARIWGAPATLSVFVLTGWFIGLGSTRSAMVIQIALNALNVVLDLWFVLGFGWGVAGVGAGTALANWAALALGLVLAGRLMARHAGSAALLPRGWGRVLDREKILHTFRVNRDIMIRTLMLLAAFVWFTNEGARLGDVVLAANTVLMQFLSFAAFFLDGFAFAAEALVGQALGARRRRELLRAIRLTTALSAGTGLVMSAFLLASGPWLIDLLTDVPAVRTGAREFLIYAAFSSFIGMPCWQLDGIFIGATRGPEMRNAAIVSTGAFLAAWAVLIGPLGNHGLWLAFLWYFVARALALLWYFPRIIRR